MKFSLYDICILKSLKARELYESISMFHSLFEISLFLVLDVAFIYVQVKGPQVRTTRHWSAPVVFCLKKWTVDMIWKFLNRAVMKTADVAFLLSHAGCDLLNKNWCKKFSKENNDNAAPHWWITGHIIGYRDVPYYRTFITNGALFKVTL